MRVQVNTPEDFAKELQDEAKHIFNSIVRLRIDRNPLNQHDTAFAVIVWATALINHQGGDWILEYGEQVGEDTQAGDFGSDKAEKIVEQISMAAHENGLRVRTGKIEII